MSGLEPIRVVRADALDELIRVLDAAVAEDAGLGPARAQLIRPLQALAAMGSEARGALGDDVFAVERLRLLVAASGSPTLAGVNLLAESELFGDGSDGISATLSMLTPDLESLAVPDDPALLELGALVVVGLAAGRVGLALGLAEPFLRNVFALALAAGPSEALLRAVAHGMSHEQVRALLAGFASQPNGGGSLSSILATSVADGSERDRWLCLRALFNLVRHDILTNSWDAAGTGSIVSVSPEQACADDVITLTLGASVSRTDGAAAQPPLDGSHFLPHLAEGDAEVLFASVGRATVGKRPANVDPKKRTVSVTVPDDVGRGWLGFVDEETFLTVNSARASVREAWEERNEKAPCLAGSPVPTDAIAELPDPPTPPRSTGARLRAGLPTVARLALDPRDVRIGEPFDLLWRVEGADSGASIAPDVGAVTPVGRRRLVADGRTARLDFTLEATNACGTVSATATGRVRSRIEGLTVGPSDSNTPPIRGRPLPVRIEFAPSDAVGQAIVTAGSWEGSALLDAGGVQVEIPAELVQDGLVGRVLLVAEDGAPDDEREFGPLRFQEISSRTVVLVRPAHVSKRLARVDADEAERRLTKAAAARGEELEIVEPVWLDDHELTLLSGADGPDTPGSERLLERLNLIAARSPGLEDALWIALVPQRGETGFHRMEPADGARAVAVATPDHLKALLDEPLPAMQAATERLRIIGRIDPDGTVRVHDARVEDRRAGPGSALDSGARAVVRSGPAERITHEVRVLGATRPARFAALVPIGDGADAIEIGSPRTKLRVRMSRSPGRPSVDALALDGEGTLTWEYEHTASSRAAFTAEVARKDGWSPVAVAGRCATSVQLALERLALGEGPQRLRIVASDGWNAAFAPEEGLPLEAPSARGAIARHANERTFWADLGREHPSDSDVRWAFGGNIRTGYVVEAPEGFTGELRLSVSGLLDDVRTISADGVVESRGLRCEECGHA